MSWPLTIQNIWDLVSNMHSNLPFSSEVTDRNLFDNISNKKKFPQIELLNLHSYTSLAPNIELVFFFFSSTRCFGHLCLLGLYGKQ